MKSIAILGLALLATAALGCGDDDVAPTDSGTVMGDAGGVPTDAGSVPRDAGVGNDAGGGGGDASTVDPRIVSVCTAAVASTCSMRPPTQADCESSLTMALTGACSAQFSAYLACATGMMVVCDAMGYTQTAGCTSEQAAFATCLGSIWDAGV